MRRFFSWKRVLGVRNPQHNYQCREREREGESAREPLALFGDSFYFFSFELAPDGEVWWWSSAWRMGREVLSCRRFLGRAQ